MHVSNAMLGTSSQGAPPSSTPQPPFSSLSSSFRVFVLLDVRIKSTEAAADYYFLHHICSYAFTNLWAGWLPSIHHQYPSGSSCRGWGLPPATFPTDSRPLWMLRSMFCFSRGLRWMPWGEWTAVVGQHQALLLFKPFFLFLRGFSQPWPGCPLWAYAGHIWVPHAAWPNWPWSCWPDHSTKIASLSGLTHPLAPHNVHAHLNSLWVPGLFIYLVFPDLGLSADSMYCQVFSFYLFFQFFMSQDIHGTHCIVLGLTDPWGLL